MPRDSNGNMTLPVGNPVQPNQTIGVDWANPTMDDLAAEIQDSLSRSGKGGIEDIGLQFDNEKTSRLYRAGPGDVRLSVLGVDAAQWNNTGQQVLSTGSTTARSLENRFADRLNVLDYGAKKDESADATAAINATILAAEAGNNKIVYMPAGRYLVLGQVNLRPGTKIEGDNPEYGANSGASSYPNQVADAKGTVIIFNPSTDLSLFKPVPPLGGSNAYSAISIRNLQIWGNTSMDDYHRGVFGDTDPVVLTSVYAIDFGNVKYSKVENVGIVGFRSGVREAVGCQVNNYVNVHIERCRNAGIEYSEATSIVFPTTSVWDTCVIRTCLHAVQSIDSGAQTWSGDSLAIRFVNCLFEDIASHMAVLPKGAQEWAFVNCYGEALTQDTGVADNACFRVGHEGISAGNNVLSLRVIGGTYAGPGTGSGTFLDVDLTNGIQLGSGMTALRFGTALKVTANTRDKSVYLDNFIFSVVTTFLTGPAGKIWGTHRSVRLDGGSDIAYVRTGFVLSDAELQLLGTTVKLGDSGTSFVRPGASTVELGQNTSRWAKVYATELDMGNARRWLTGTGTPEGVVTAPIGSLYTREDGGPNTTLYVKEGGVSSTGWVAK